jgi:glutamyl-tRNA synthetase
MEDLEPVARKFALQNAALHGGKPDAKAVQGKLLAERAELRPRAKELVPLVQRVCADVAGMSVELQRAELERVAPEMLAPKERGEKKPVLPPLPGAVEGQVVMRLAPYPSGPLHIGNARMVVLNDEYVRRYKGKMLLVFDDTIGSEEKFPVLEAYDLIKAGVEGLGVRIDAVHYKSDRIPLFHEWAVRMLARGYAYVCQCSAEELRALREQGRACAHRARAPEDSLHAWEKMLSGAFREGEAVVRLKTDMQHKNPAFRDRVLLRIADRPHPRVGTKHRVWPLLEFSWAVDDHLLGITHVLRGKDLVMEDLMEQFVWDLLKIRGPQFFHYGMLRVAEAKLSKSKSRAEVMGGQYRGWHDPRTWSLQSLAARGIQPQALRNFVLSFGMSQQDIEVPSENLYAENRKLVEPDADRYFFVADPRPLLLQGAPRLVAHPPLHPEHPERGARELVAEGEVLLAAADAAALDAGQKFRLKDLGNFELTSAGPRPAARYIGNDLALTRQGAPILHWLPPPGEPATLVTVEGEEVRGVVEPAAARDEGRVVQFERVGFARIASAEPFEAYWAHR